MTDPIWPWADSLPSSDWSWLHGVSTSDTPAKRDDDRIVSLHEAGDGHAVFWHEVTIQIRRFGHLLTLTDQVLLFTFESSPCCTS